MPKINLRTISRAQITVATPASATEIPVRLATPGSIHSIRVRRSHTIYRFAEHPCVELLVPFTVISYSIVVEYSMPLRRASNTIHMRTRAAIRPPLRCPTRAGSTPRLPKPTS
ncbi:MAG: hypothetical protein NVS2B7_01460 [Herpetosiphon sp.]